MASCCRMHDRLPRRRLARAVRLGALVLLSISVLSARAAAGNALRPSGAVAPEAQAQPARAHAPAEDPLIVDDRDPWEDALVCPGGPCPPTGFKKEGPEERWGRNMRGSDRVWAGSALWVPGVHDLDQSRNAATWATILGILEGGDWELLAYIPDMATGTAYTQAARYCIEGARPPLAARGAAAAPADVTCLTDVVINQEANRGHWTSLGIHTFAPDPEISASQVTLTDWVNDWPPVSVVVDALKWVKVDPTGADVTIDAFIRDGENGPRVPDGTVFDADDPIAICAAVSRTARVAITVRKPDGPSPPETRDVSDEWCLTGKVGGTPGRRDVTARASDPVTGQPWTADSTSYVMRGAVPTTTFTSLPPTPTVTPQPSATQAGPEYDVWLRDHADEAHVPLGTDVVYCVRVMPVEMRINWAKVTVLLPDGTIQVPFMNVIGPGLSECKSIASVVPGRYTIGLQVSPNGGRRITGEDEAHYTAGTAAPTPTAVPAPSPLLPVVIVPGYGHSFPFGTTRNPFTYPAELDGLMRLFEQVGIEYVDCHYDWTNDNTVSADQYLRACVEAVRSGGDVHIVTHSNGALVARAYVQGTADPHVNTLFMIAPPNQGVVGAYYPWAGGDLRAEDFTYKLAINAAAALSLCPRVDDLCRFTYFHSVIPSLGQLTGTEAPYLRDYRSGQFLPLSAMETRNTFLEDLNARSELLLQRTRRLVVYRGTGTRTASTIDVEPLQQQDGRWRDGRPVAGPATSSSAGDNRILAERALVPGIARGERYEVIDRVARHNELIERVAPSIILKMGARLPLAAASQWRPPHGEAMAPADADTARGWLVTARTSGSLLVVDRAGRQSGTHPEGRTVAQIPGSTVALTSDPRGVVVALSPSAGSTYRVVVLAPAQTSDAYAASVVSASSGDIVWRRVGMLLPEEEFSEVVDLAQRNIIFLPTLTK